MKFSTYAQYLFCCLLVLSINSCKKNTPVETVPEQQVLTLNPPGDLQIISMTDTAVVLSWTDNSNSEVSFDIEQSIDSVTFSVVQSMPANTTTATIPGAYLTTNMYYFRVKAKSSTATSGASNVVKRTLFPAPTGLGIVAMTASSITLRWTDNSTFETGFDVEESANGSAYSIVGTLGADATSSTISAPFDSNQTYSFRVCAKTSLNKSAYSNTLSRTLGAWVYVKGGPFQMGRNGEFNDERPVHSVSLKSYYIAKCEVTVKEYREFTTATGRSFPAAPGWGWHDDDPMVYVSWNDARDYCAWISDTTGKTIRMPTEAEWEYAARGGSLSQGCSYSGSNTLSDVAWCFANAKARTQPVGTMQPNELGVYDMSGNAWEWCADWYCPYSSQPQANPTGPSYGTVKIFRGGSWFDYGLGTSDCRVETRYNYTPGSKVSDGGFRVVQDL